MDNEKQNENVQRIVLIESTFLNPEVDHADGSWPSEFLTQRRGQHLSLDPAARLQLVREAANQDKKAQNKLIKFLLPQAYELAASCTTDRNDFEDLVQAGLLTVLRALKNFDVNKNRNVDLFLKRRLRWGMLAYQNKHSASMPLPRRTLELLHKIDVSEMRLSAKLDRKPSDFEIANDIVLDIDVDIDMKEKLVRSTKKTRRICSVTNLDESLSDIDDQTYMIPKSLIENALIPDLYAEHAELRQFIASMLKELTAEETVLVKARFYDDMPLDKIAAAMGRGRTTVTKKLKKALRKLKTKAMQRFGGGVSELRSADAAGSESSNVVKAMPWQDPSNDLITQQLYRDSLQPFNKTVESYPQKDFLDHLAGVLKGAHFQPTGTHKQALQASGELAGLLLQDLLSKHIVKKVHGNELVVTKAGTAWLDSTGVQRPAKSRLEHKGTE